MNTNVQKVTSLSKLPRAEEAIDLLNRLVRDCSPLMKRKGWTVKHLKEFYPKEEGLLGLNVNRGNTIKITKIITRFYFSLFFCLGAVISIRLRPPNS